MSGGTGPFPGPKILSGVGRAHVRILGWPGQGLHLRWVLVSVSESFLSPAPVMAPTLMVLVLVCRPAAYPGLPFNPGLGDWPCSPRLFRGQ